ncbi:MAG: rhamnosyltransferase [Marmoricola sp.]
MSNAGVVVVLFRPTSQHLANVAAVRAQCEQVLAIDNSPSPSEKTQTALREAGVAVIENRNAGGLAGAYNRGVHALRELGCDCVLFLDQDSTVPPGYVRTMLEGVAALEGQPFLVGPRIHEMDLGMLVPITVETLTAEAPRHLITTDFVISSGSLLSIAAYEKLGDFRDDYFIEAIDIEYCLRAQNVGVPVYVNTEVALDHITGEITRHGRFYATNHNASRCYYRVRNFIHAAMTWRAGATAARRSSGFALRQLATVLFLESDKTRKVTATLLGIADGLVGRLGPLEQRHPRLAPWLNGATVPTVRRANRAQ